MAGLVLLEHLLARGWGQTYLLYRGTESDALCYSLAEKDVILTSPFFMCAHNLDKNRSLVIMIASCSSNQFISGVSTSPNTVLLPEWR